MPLWTRNCAGIVVAYRPKGTRLSLRLYLDDCAYSKLLLQILQGPPYQHTVTIPNEAGLRGASDPDHFAYARVHGLIVITKNPDDFEALHRDYPDHPGIFAIYQDNDPRDMSYTEIAQAISSIVAAGMQIAGAFHVLNRWRY